LLLGLAIIVTAPFDADANIIGAINQMLLAPSFYIFTLFNSFGNAVHSMGYEVFVLITLCFYSFVIMLVQIAVYWFMRMKRCK